MSKESILPAKVLTGVAFGAGTVGEAFQEAAVWSNNNLTNSGSRLDEAAHTFNAIVASAPDMKAIGLAAAAASAYYLFDKAKFIEPLWEKKGKNIKSVEVVPLPLPSDTEQVKKRNPVSLAASVIAGSGLSYLAYRYGQNWSVGRDILLTTATTLTSYTYHHLTQRRNNS